MQGSNGVVGVPDFQEGLLKFSDSLIASTSSENGQVCVWETQTLAPLESFKSDKFCVSPNTLQATATGFILGTHVQKTTLAAWRWDKTSQPILKSPTKEELSAVRICSNLQGQEMLICGSKKGKILIYQLAMGQLIAEVQNAHYLAINDLDLAHASDTARQADLIITAGQDSKVKVWNLTALLSQSNMSEDTAMIGSGSSTGCYHEFSDHTGAVTSVKFSYGASLQRAFSGSLDKTFKVYDLPSKLVLKTIQLTSPIIRLTVDQLESTAFIACENLNVYQMPLNNQNANPDTTSDMMVQQAIQSAGAGASSTSMNKATKRTFTHKKRITALTLTVDDQQLVTGDSGGTIYVWNLAVEGDNSMGGDVRGDQLLKTLEIHSEYGAITNLVALNRPLSLFGLTANMQAYEPGELKPLQRQQQSVDQLNAQVQTIQLAPINNQDDSDEEEDFGLQEEMGEYAELEYFCQAASAVAVQGVRSGSAVIAKKQPGRGAAAAVTTAQAGGNDDFIGLDNQTENNGGEKNNMEGEDEVGQIEKLREENKRLKKTLLDKFQSEGDVV